MSTETSNTWESEIRAREDELRLAFLAADTSALESLFADGYLVNSPMQQVIEKPKLLQLLRAGKIKHLSFEIEIERIIRYGDVVIVMGHDFVTDPPDGTRSSRRFTNVWLNQSGKWCSIARHAHVLPSGHA